MKPKESGGVVDSKLNVYGVEGLKVAGRLKIISVLVRHLLIPGGGIDVSIPPSNVHAVS